MPTKNPRLTMTLSPPLAAQLRRMSELTGNSQAALVSELLEGNSAVFDRLIRLLEAARDAKGEMVAQFVEDMNAAQSKIEQQLNLSLEALDVATPAPQDFPPLLEGVEKVKRRAGRAAPEGPRPAGKPARTAPERRPRDPLLLTGGSK